MGQARSKQAGVDPNVMMAAPSAFVSNIVQARRSRVQPIAAPSASFEIPTLNLKERDYSATNDRRRGSADGYDGGGRTSPSAERYGAYSPRAAPSAFASQMTQMAAPVAAVARAPRAAPVAPWHPSSPPPLLDSDDDDDEDNSTFKTRERRSSFCLLAAPSAFDSGVISSQQEPSSGLSPPTNNSFGVSNTMSNFAMHVQAVRQPLAAPSSRIDAGAHDPQLPPDAVVRNASSSATDGDVNAARAFQHSTGFVHHVYRAVDVPLAALDDATDGEYDVSSAADASTSAANAAATGKYSVLLSADQNDSLHLREKTAARVLLGWRDSAVAGFVSTTTTDGAAVGQHQQQRRRREQGDTGASVLREAEARYQSGDAASVVALAMSVIGTDAAGDRLLEANDGHRYLLSALDANASGDLASADGRDVALFVSSTFVDMNEERDVLIRRVFPSLHEFCAERGIRLTPMDLRWGITDQQSRQGSTIDICLREVERARPYFLCLLGARYGWAQPLSSNAPRDRLLQATVERAAKTYDWIAKYSNRSITELEVRHAVLNAFEATEASGSVDQERAAWLGERAVFYLRDEKTQLDPRLARLRDQIQAYARVGKLKHVVPYSKDGLEALASSAAARLRAILAQDFPLRAVPSPLAAEAAAHDALCARLSRGFVARPHYFELLDATAQQRTAGTSAILAVVGPAGVGKTALLANWLRRARSSDSSTGPFMLAHFVTASAQSAQLVSTLRRMIAELSKAFSLGRHYDDDSNDLDIAPQQQQQQQQQQRVNAPDAVADGDDLPGTGVFATLTGGASGDDGGGGAQLQLERLSTTLGEVLRGAAQRAGAGIVLVLDGVDLLGDGALRWLPTPLPPGVRVLLGARTVPAGVQNRCDIVNLALLPPLQRALVCARRLARASKSLSATQLDIVARSKSMGLPLFNRIVSDELTLLGDFEGLTAKLTRYVSLSDTTALRRVVLERVAAEFARPPGRDSLLADVLACLLVVPNGLHESELIAASSCPPVTWSLLRTSLAGTVLIFRGELLTLADADVVTVARQLCDAASLERARTALDQHYADSAEREFERLRSELAQSRERSAHAYVRGARAPPLPHSTTLVRSLRMRAALLANAGRVNELRDCLSQPDVFEILWSDSGAAEGYAARYDLYKHWRVMVAQHASLGDELIGELESAGNVMLLQLEQGTRMRHERSLAARQARSSDGFSLSTFDVVDDDSHDDIHALATTREQALALVRRATALSQFAREAITAKASQRAANVALRIAQQLRSGRRGAGRVVTMQAAVAYASRLCGDLPLATSLYRAALSEAERIVSGTTSDAGRATATDQDGAVVGACDARLAQLINALAICLRQQAKYKEASVLYRRALNIRQTLLGEKHPDTAQSHNSLGCLYQDLGDYETADYHLQLAVSLRESLLGKSHPDVAMSLLNVGGLRIAQGRMKDAVVAYERAKAIYTAAYGERNSNVAHTINALAGVASEMRRDVEARRLYAKAIAIRREVLGDQHQDLAVSLNDLAVMHVREGEHDKAEPLYRQALAIRLKTLGENHIDTAASKANLGLLCQDLQRYDEAQTLMQSALETTQHTLGPDHVDVAGCWRNLAGLAQSRENYDTAIANYTKALVIYRNKVGPLHIDVALTANDAAVCRMKMNQPAAAEQLYRDAYDAYVSHFGPSHADVALCQLNIAECVATQAIERGSGSGVVELIDRASEAFQRAKELFTAVKKGAVSGAGAVGITREVRLQHIDRSLEQLRLLKSRVE